MNKAQLNAGVVGGSGSSASFALLSATQAFELSSVCASALVASAICLQDFAVTTSSAVGAYLYGTATQNFELSPAVTSAVAFQRLAGAMGGQFELTGAAPGGVGFGVTANQAMELTGALTSTVITAVMGGINGFFEMAGNDQYTGAAPLARTVTMSENTRVITVADSATSTGV